MKTMSRSVFNSALIVLSVLLASNATRADSLWPATGTTPAKSMFADRKAAAKGDILTIVVSESAVAQTSQNKTSQRESSIDDAVQQFLFSVAASGLGTHNGELPHTKLGGKAAYSGGGQVNNSQSVSARAAVLVSDVLPNGNMVIEGVRLLTFAGETQYVVLHGVVRPDDISRENSIFSTNVADARLEFFAEGQLTDAQKRGWLTKVYEKLRPF
jgi:flagellar L-ring protein precursor FlgH